MQFSKQKTRFRKYKKQMEENVIEYEQVRLY